MISIVVAMDVNQPVSYTHLIPVFLLLVRKEGG